MTASDDRMSLLPWLAVGTSLWLVTLTCALAQTCTAPINVSGSANFTASTCAGTIDMPFINSGTTFNRGPDVVYQFTVPASPNLGSVTLQPDPNIDLALFLCTGKCSTYATCFNWVDNGPGNADTMSIPSGFDLFVVIAHPSPATPLCGNFSLQITYPSP